MSEFMTTWQVTDDLEVFGMVLGQHNTFQHDVNTADASI